MSTTSYNIIIGICAAIIGIIAFADEFPKIKTLQFIKLYKVIIFLIATTIGIWATIKKDSSTEIENANENIKNTYKIIDSIGKYVERSKVTLKEEIDTLHSLNSNIFKQEQELMNQYTGGENTPILDLSSFNKMFTYNENIHYCTLVFSVLNDGKYPVHDVRIIITDMFGRDMLKYRAEVTNGTATMIVPNEEAYKNYDPVKVYEFSTIPKDVKNSLYMTDVSPELCSRNSIPPEYIVNMQWSNGILRYIIKCDLDENGISISNVEFIVNNEKIDYHKYFKTNIPIKP